jgi:hypothetical protein
MDEEEKRYTINLLKGTQNPIRLTHFPEKKELLAESGSQNIKITAPNPSGRKDASAILEKELQLGEKANLYLAHELRKGGDESTGLHLKSPNLKAGFSTDYDKEELGYLSARGNTPLGRMGINLNTDFTQNESGEILWRSPDGRWNATGFTDFDDLQRAGIGYNTDNLNINFNTDFGGNEYLEGEYRPSPYINLGGGTDFGENRNIYAGANYPINDNWNFDARLGRRENPYEDENYWNVGLRGNW